MRRVVGALAVTCLVAGCSTRSPAPARPDRSPYASRSGFLPGFRLRPGASPYDGEGRTAPQAAETHEGAYGPTGRVAEDAPYDDWGRSGSASSCDRWGTVAPPVGPSGAVDPGLRAPSDVPLLQPASPYRGPADPPDVHERPGTAAGNDTFRHR